MWIGKDNSITVADTAAGSQDKQQQTGKSALEVVHTILHAAASRRRGIQGLGRSPRRRCVRRERALDAAHRRGAPRQQGLDADVERGKRRAR